MIRKRSWVSRLHFNGISPQFRERWKRIEKHEKRRIIPTGRVRRVENNRKFAWIKWCGAHRATREPVDLLIAVTPPGR
jgi:hypothetical protein